MPATVVDLAEQKKIAPAERLTAEQLYRPCDPSTLGFRTTKKKLLGSAG
jgi:hypothetical protein